jgi:transcription initiation factor TFIID subunit 5
LDPNANNITNHRVGGGRIHGTTETLDGSTKISSGTTELKEKKTDSNGTTITTIGTSSASGTISTTKTSNALVSPSSSGGTKGTASSSTAGGGGGGNISSGSCKTKRPKFEVNDAIKKKQKPSILDIQGPVPDRKNFFSAEILEKLILRRPNEIKLAELEDLRVRACLNKSRLPSALCFTFLNAPCHVNNICFSEDTALVGATFDDASFRVWRNDDQPLGTCAGIHESAHSNVPDEEKNAILRGHSSTVYGACFSPDNRFALTSSADATIRLWSLAARANMVCYKAHQYPVWDVNFSSLGYYFASCSMDRTARLWSTDRVHPLRVFAGHLSDVNCVQFHPNHNYLATGSSDKTVRLWDIQSGSCLRIFTGHFNGVKAIAFSPNGRYLASSGEDRYINIWDLNAGKRLETLVGHKASVYSLDFSKESTLLASGGADSTVRLWDMQSLVSASSSSSLSIHEQEINAKASTSTSTNGSGITSFVKRVTMIKPTAIEDVAPSRFLLKTLRSKQTPIYRVKFTPRNLLLTGGSFHPEGTTTHHSTTTGSDSYE